MNAKRPPAKKPQGHASAKGPDDVDVPDDIARTPAVEVTDGFVMSPDVVMKALVAEVDWEKSMSARYTASYGVPYNYAQMVYPAAPLHPRLVPINDALHQTLGVRFNNCLLNFYLNERSKMGFHSDETKDLQPNTGVAIVSLGEARAIHFRRRDFPQVRCTFQLEPGSLLWMGIAVQHEWAHAIKKRPHAGQRISLTWRAFVDDSAPSN